MNKFHFIFDKTTKYIVMTKEEALLNARMAYILHHKDYDKETGEVFLWQAPTEE